MTEAVTSGALICPLVSPTLTSLDWWIWPWIFVGVDLIGVNRIGADLLRRDVVGVDRLRRRRRRICRKRLRRIALELDVVRARKAADRKRDHREPGAYGHEQFPAAHVRPPLYDFLNSLSSSIPRASGREEPSSRRRWRKYRPSAGKATACEEITIYRVSLTGASSAGIQCAG
jgi:hypothetical protein